MNPILKVFSLFFILLVQMLFTYHPMGLSLTLVLMAMAAGVGVEAILGKWPMYILILVVLGGMMVIFLYVSALGNQVKIKYKMLLSEFMILILFVVFTTLSPAYGFFFFNTSSGGLSKMFSSSKSGCLFFCISFLLIGLFIVVKFSESFKGSLMKLKY